jgi:hypothetical protein
MVAITDHFVLPLVWLILYPSTSPCGLHQQAQKPVITQLPMLTFMWLEWLDWSGTCNKLREKWRRLIHYASFLGLCRVRWLLVSLPWSELVMSQIFLMDGWAFQIGIWSLECYTASAVQSNIFITNSINSSSIYSLQCTIVMLARNSKRHISKI